MLTNMYNQFDNLSLGQQICSVAGCIAAGITTLCLSYAAYYRLNEKRHPFNSYTTSTEAINGLNLTNKYAIVTGSNTGIGKETAKVLYQQGCNVILACRNIEKANNAKTHIINAIKSSNKTSKGTIKIIKLDLSSLESVRTFAQQFTSSYKQLNYLINNAGIMASPNFEVTSEGYEKQFGVNHLGHFLLVKLLFPMILNSKTRIINVSSLAHEMSSYDEFNSFLDKALKSNDGPAKEDYEPWLNYGISKTSNILFTRELDRRYAKDGIVSVSLMPGAIFGTELARNVKFSGMSSVKLMLGMFRINFVMDNMKSVSQGAATTLRCVSLDDKEIKGGHYYHNCRSGRDFNKLYGAAKTSLSMEYSDYETESIEGRLWKLSEQLIVQKGFKMTL